MTPGAAQRHPRNAVPITLQTFVDLCTVTGWKTAADPGHRRAKIYHGVCFGDQWSAIQITTAGTCVRL